MSQIFLGSTRKEELHPAKWRLESFKLGCSPRLPKAVTWSNHVTLAIKLNPSSTQRWQMIAGHLQCLYATCSLIYFSFDSTRCRIYYRAVFALQAAMPERPGPSLVSAYAMIQEVHGPPREYENCSINAKGPFFSYLTLSRL